MHHCWEPASPFSGFFCDRRPPLNSLRFPFDTTFASSVHFGDTENTARRLLVMVRQLFSELSTSAFIQLYCTMLRPHLESALEANAPTLKADIKELERAERLATWLVRGIRHMAYGKRLSQLNLFSLEHRCLQADLILAINIVTLARLIFRPAHPRLG